MLDCYLYTKNFAKMIIIVTTIVISFLLFAPQSVFAKSGDLKITPQSEPLFKNENIAPGKTISKMVNFHNTSEDQTYEIGVFAETTKDEDGLLDEIKFEIIDKERRNVLPESIKTLADFIDYTSNGNSFILTSFGPKEQELFEFITELPFELSNDWQGRSASFDFEFGYSGSVLGEETGPKTEVLGVQLSQTGQNILAWLAIGLGLLILAKNYLKRK